MKTIITKKYTKIKKAAYGSSLQKEYGSSVKEQMDALNDQLDASSGKNYTSDGFRNKSMTRRLKEYYRLSPQERTDQMWIDGDHKALDDCSDCAKNISPKLLQDLISRVDLSSLARIANRKGRRFAEEYLTKTWKIPKGEARDELIERVLPENIIDEKILRMIVSQGEESAKNYLMARHFLSEADAIYYISELKQRIYGSLDYEQLKQIILKFNSDETAEQWLDETYGKIFTPIQKRQAIMNIREVIRQEQEVTNKEKEHEQKLQEEERQKRERWQATQQKSQPTTKAEKAASIDRKAQVPSYGINPGDFAQAKPPPNSTKLTVDTPKLPIVRQPVYKKAPEPPTFTYESVMGSINQNLDFGELIGRSIEKAFHKAGLQWRFHDTDSNVIDFIYYGNMPNEEMEKNVEEYNGLLDLARKTEMSWIFKHAGPIYGIAAKIMGFLT